MSGDMFAAAGCDKEPNGFGSLLHDPLFVDFFNVYLNQPIFAQKCIFNQEKKSFEFDPPILGANKLHVDRALLLNWLLHQRVPCFLSSPVYREYKLAKLLLPSAVSVLGSACGLRRFREHIHGTPADTLLSFWLDTQHFLDLQAHEEAEKWRRFRLIQTKYFHIEKLVSDDESKETNIQMLQDGSLVVCGSSWEAGSEASIDQKEQMQQALKKIVSMQNISIAILKAYWIPRYLDHVRHQNRTGEEETLAPKQLVDFMNEQQEYGSLRDMKPDRSFNSLYALRGSSAIDIDICGSSVTFDPNDSGLIDKMMEVTSTCTFEVEISESTQKVLESSASPTIDTPATEIQLSVGFPVPNEQESEEPSVRSIPGPFKAVVESEQSTTSDHQSALNSEASEAWGMDSSSSSGSSNSSSCSDTSTESVARAGASGRKTKNKTGQGENSDKARPKEAPSVEDESSVKTVKGEDSSKTNGENSTSCVQKDDKDNVKGVGKDLSKGFIVEGIASAQESTKDSRDDTTLESGAKTISVQMKTSQCPVTSSQEDSKRVGFSPHVDDTKLSSKSSHRSTKLSPSKDLARHVVTKEFNKKVESTYNTMTDQLLQCMTRLSCSDSAASDMTLTNLISPCNSSRASFAEIHSSVSLAEYMSHAKCSSSTLLDDGRATKDSTTNKPSTVHSDIIEPPVDSEVLLGAKAQSATEYFYPTHLPPISSSNFHSSASAPSTTKSLTTRSHHRKSLRLPRLPTNIHLQTPSLVATPKLIMARNKAQVNPLVHALRRHPAHDMYFRYTRAKLVQSVASDKMAGYPLHKMLTATLDYAPATDLLFWHHVQEYLSFSPQYVQSSSVIKQLRFRQGRLLIVQFLQECSPNKIPLSSHHIHMLWKMLMVEKGDTSLREAQDVVCARVLEAVLLFRARDRHRFYSMCVRDMNDEIIDVRKLLMKYEDTYLDEAEPTFLPDSESDRREKKALLLSLNMAGLDDQCIVCGEELSLPELTYDCRFGSLGVLHREIKQRPDIVLYNKYVQRQAELAWQRNEKKKAEEAARQQLMATLSRTERDLNNMDQMFAHHVMYNAGGSREPTQGSVPKSFYECMHGTGQKEYFRKFLLTNGAEAAFTFYHEVEDMKGIKDLKSKQHKINHIVKRYLPNPEAAEKHLQCNDDIIHIIPVMQKITPTMLSSAQTCILRSLQDNWYEKYLATFQDGGSSEHPEHEEEEEEEDHCEKDATYKLWRSFMSRLALFRKVLIQPNRFQEFERFLQKEMRREIKKVHGNANVPIRKMMNNRVVDICKTVNDLHFFLEVDRYREVCDAASIAAKTGLYSIEDDHLVESKAKTIIETFLTSELPPRIQVNISQEQVDEILHNYSSGIIERGLFHKVLMDMLPAVAHLWRRFNIYRVGTAMRGVRSSKRSSYRIPNYMRIEDRDIIRKLVPAKSADASPNIRIMFSLAHGCRFYVPTSEGGIVEVMEEGSEGELQRTESDSNNSSESPIVEKKPKPKSPTKPPMHAFPKRVFNAPVHSGRWQKKGKIKLRRKDFEQLGKVLQHKIMIGSDMSLTDDEMVPASNPASSTHSNEMLPILNQVSRLGSVMMPQVMQKLAQDKRDRNTLRSRGSSAGSRSPRLTSGRPTRKVAR